MKFRLTSRSLTLAVALLAAQGMGARADEPSANALALAAKVIDVVGLKTSVDMEVPQLAREIQGQLTQLHPEMTESLRESLIAIMPEYEKADAGILADLAHVLATKMTEQELKETVAFFESPTGKKYLASQPVLLQALSISGNAWRPKLANDVMSRLREEMKKKGYEF